MTATAVILSSPRDLSQNLRCVKRLPEEQILSHNRKGKAATIPHIPHLELVLMMQLVVRNDDAIY